MRGLIAALFAALALVSGHALAAGPTSSTAPVVLTQTTATRVAATAGATLPPGPLADLISKRQYATGSVEGAALLKDLLDKAPGPKGQMAVKAVRAVPWSAIAKGVGRAHPVVATALTIKEILDAMRCRPKEGGVECDEGQPEQEKYQYCTEPAFYSAEPGGSDGTYQGCASTSQGAIVALAEKLNTSAKLGTSNIGPTGFMCVRATYSSWCQVNVLQPTVALACPEVTVNGVKLFPMKSPDGLCPTTVYEEVTEEQVGDKVEQHGDKSKAVAAMKELDKAAIPVEHPSPTFEVPPKVEGERQTEEHPDGSTTVRDPVFEISPKGTEGYEWVPKIIETTYPPGAIIPPQGQPPTQPSTVTSGPKPEDQAVPPTDPLMPPVPPLYERKYPEGLAGVWQARKAELEASPIFAFLASLVPSFGDGGCPVWALPVDVLGISHAGTEATVPCYVWAFVRLVIIITALLLCRRLIFGG